MNTRYTVNLPTHFVRSVYRYKRLLRNDNGLITLAKKAFFTKIFKNDKIKRCILAISHAALIIAKS
jgi:hypothetical protein